MTPLARAAKILCAISILVSQRTGEFGIRVALGARRSDVGLTVIRESLSPALAGVAVGSLGAWALWQVVQSSVFGWDFLARVTGGARTRTAARTSQQPILC
jgi:ABC-type antimicrobial peptide transport system permease subunit